MKLKLMIRSAIFLALIAIGARIQFPLPYFDYYTLQFPFILLTGLVLPPRYTFFATGGYLALGLVGIPVFAGGGGPAYILQPSFGYLLGFAVTAIVLSYIYHNNKNKLNNFKGYIILNLLGVVITYAFGIAYKVLILTFYLNEAVPTFVLLASSLAFDIPADIIVAIILAVFETKILKSLTIALKITPQENIDTLKN